MPALEALTRRDLLRGAGAAAAAIALPAAASTAPNAMVISRTRAVIAASNRLGAAVLDRMIASSPRNVFVSPYSLNSALSMLALGARGSTRRTLLNALGYSRVGIDEAVSGHRALATLLGAEAAGIDMRLANALFTDGAVTPRRSLTDQLRSAFGAEIRSIGFGSPHAVDEINAWVSRSTRAAIPTIVDQLDGQTEFVLANALYFKGIWTSRFDEADTGSAAFRNAFGDTVDVPMMKLMLDADYGRDGALHAVELPYGNGRFAMLVVTSVDPDDFSPLRVALANGLDRLALLTTMATYRVTLRMPRFTAATSVDLTGDLAALGFSSALSPRADFGRISGRATGPTKVLQRVMMQVDEEGSTAAAATAVVATRSAAQPAEAIFDADRPFAIVLRERASGVHLFTGLMAAPAA